MGREGFPTEIASRIWQFLLSWVVANPTPARIGYNFAASLQLPPRSLLN